MPWCPKCNAEYQQGFTVCSDCKVELVESLEKDLPELVPFFQAEDKKIADKLVRYFKYSDVKSQVSYDEENELYLVSIPPNMETQAKKLYQAFYFVERDNIANGLFNESDEEESEDTSDGPDASTKNETEVENEEPSVDVLEEELYQSDAEASDVTGEETDAEITDDEFTGVEVAADTTTYIMKADKYKDLAGTVWIFLLFGVAGLAFVLLNVVGLLTFLNGWMPNTVMGALFIFFIYVALSTNSKAKTIKAEIETENLMTDKINSWLKLNFTKEFLDSIHNDNISEELNYIKMTDTVKELLIKEFGTQNLAYLDKLIEDYYNINFEQVEE